MQIDNTVGAEEKYRCELSVLLELSNEDGDLSASIYPSQEWFHQLRFRLMEQEHVDYFAESRLPAPNVYNLPVDSDHSLHGTCNHSLMSLILHDKECVILPNRHVIDLSAVVMIGRHLTCSGAIYGVETKCKLNV